jgi:hypothetical protein
MVYLVDSVRNSLMTLWAEVLSFLPALIGAIVIFIIGLIIASILDRIVERVIYYLRLDVLFRRLGVESYFQRAGIKLNVGYFVGRLVYWFMVIAFLLAASDMLGFVAFSGFLNNVLAYIPSVLVGVLIVLAALVAANFLKKLVIVSISGARLSHAKGLGALTWWIVFIFGFLTALVQVGVAVAIINTVITGFIAMLAIAGGLAFGLGGREQASRFLTKVGEEISHGGK